MINQQIKKIMNVADLLPIIDLPWKETEQVEVFIVPVNKNDNNLNENDNTTNLARIKKIQDSLSQYVSKELKSLSNENLRKFEKEAWARHCEEKYDNVRY